MIQALKNLFAQYPLDFYSHFFLLLPVLIAIYRREYLTIIISIVVLYFAIRFIEESVFLYYAVKGKHMHSLNNGVLAVDILIVGELYYLTFKNNPIVKKITVFATAAAFLITLCNYMLNGPISVSNTIMRLLCILLAFAYFNKILSENRIRKIWLNTLFWVSSGFMIYCMGTFMRSLFSDYLLDPIKTPNETYDTFLAMDQVLNIIKCILAAVGMWVSKSDRDNYISQNNV